MTLAFSLFLWLAVMAVLAKGFPVGAPNFVCKSMRPLHPFRAQSLDTFPYTVTINPDRALPGNIVSVTLSTTHPEDRFNGVLATAVDENTNTLVPGFIISTADHWKLLDCTSSEHKGNGLTHTQKLNATTKTFRWRVPADAFLGSDYTIRLTVVRNVAMYWPGFNTTFTVGAPRRTPVTSQNSNRNPSNRALPDQTGNRPATSSGTTSQGSGAPPPPDSRLTAGQSNLVLGGGDMASTNSQRPLERSTSNALPGGMGTGRGRPITGRPSAPNQGPFSAQQVSNGSERQRARPDGAQGQTVQGPLSGGTVEVRGWEGRGNAGNQQILTNVESQEMAQNAGMAAWLSGWFGR